MRVAVLISGVVYIYYMSRYTNSASPERRAFLVFKDRTIRTIGGIPCTAYYRVSREEHFPGIPRICIRRSV